MYIQQQQKRFKPITIVLVVVVILFAGTYVQHVVFTSGKRFSFEPVIPSIKQINDISSVPSPIKYDIPFECSGVDFQWLASDRTYWDGWVSKSMFFTKDGRFTQKDVQIGEGESICIGVILGPIPAVATIKNTPHFAPSDSIVITAKTSNTDAAIPIVLQQHEKQRNVYFASVKFNYPGVWALHTSVEHRSYFWEQPTFHKYQPNRFVSDNRLTVYKKPTNEGETQQQSDSFVEQPLCDFVNSPRTLKDSIWMNNEIAGSDVIFRPSCQIPMDKVCLLSQKTIHMWGDKHLKRNLQHLIGDDGPRMGMCDHVETQQQNDIDTPITLLDSTDVHFGYIDTNIVDNHRRWKIDMLGLSRTLPKADVVIMGLGNEDMSSIRQHPNDFARVFMSLLDYVVNQVYPHQRIIVKTTQYYVGNTKSLNYGRSQAYANVIRSAIANLPLEDRKRVRLWDTNEIGYVYNQCKDSLTTNRQVVSIENAILTQLLC